MGRRRVAQSWWTVSIFKAPPAAMGLICINGARVAATKMQDTHVAYKRLIDIKSCAAPSAMLNVSRVCRHGEHDENG
jgi:hypothetical protein